MSSIESFSNTPEGSKALKDAIKKNNDGSFTVHFKGSGGKDCTVSEKELAEAKALGQYSTGDVDVLILEKAFEKYCDENDSLGDRTVGTILKIKGARKSIEGKTLEQFSKALLGEKCVESR